MRGPAILANAANPGKVGTGLNRHTGERIVEQGAMGMVDLARLDEKGATGAFPGADGVVPWQGEVRARIGMDSGTRVRPGNPVSPRSGTRS